MIMDEWKNIELTTQLLLVFRVNITVFVKTSTHLHVMENCCRMYLEFLKIFCSDMYISQPLKWKYQLQQITSDRWKIFSGHYGFLYL